MYEYIDTLGLNFREYYTTNSKIIDVIENIQLFNNDYDVYNSFIHGQSYENNDSNHINDIKYIVVNKDGNIINEQFSLDGSFKIENLMDGTNINLIVIDTKNKFNGKYFQNIMPIIDYQKYMKIIKIYHVNDNALFRIKYSGEHTLSLINGGTLIKVDDYHYKVTNITTDFKLSLVDYVDGNAYMLEKTYQLEIR